MAEIHVGDIGTVFEYTILNEQAYPVNLSEASEMIIILSMPNRSTMVKNAEISTDGSDGKMRYVIQANDLSAHGTWRTQARISVPSGTWYTDISEFTVERNL